jgi:hypothetical protein
MSALFEEPVPNLPLLRKVLDHIDAHPEEWEQGSWAIQSSRYSCGTAYCLAGHVAVMTGHEPAWDSIAQGEFYADHTTADACIGDVAQAELGITTEEADALFQADNSRTALREISEIIAARVGEVL